MAVIDKLNPFILKWKVGFINDSAEEEDSLEIE